MSKFKRKSATKFLDWSHPPRPPLKICPNLKKMFKVPKFLSKKVPQKFWIGVSPPRGPPPKKSVRIQADKSASNNLGLGLTPAPFGQCPNQNRFFFRDRVP